MFHHFSWLNHQFPPSFHGEVVPLLVQDGSFVSSGYRSVAFSDILESPFVAPEHRDVVHVGPVNMKRALGNGRRDRGNLGKPWESLGKYGKC